MFSGSAEPLDELLRLARFLPFALAAMPAVDAGRDLQLVGAVRGRERERADVVLVLRRGEERRQGGGDLDAIAALPLPTICWVCSYVVPFGLLLKQASLVQLEVAVVDRVASRSW